MTHPELRRHSDPSRGSVHETFSVDDQYGRRGRVATPEQETHGPFGAWSCPAMARSGKTPPGPAASLSARHSCGRNGANEGSIVGRLLQPRLAARWCRPQRPREASMRLFRPPRPRPSPVVPTASRARKRTDTTCRAIVGESPAKCPRLSRADVFARPRRKTDYWRYSASRSLRLLGWALAGKCNESG